MDLYLSALGGAFFGGGNFEGFEPIKFCIGKT